MPNFNFELRRCITLPVILAEDRQVDVVCNVLNREFFRVRIWDVGFIPMRTFRNNFLYANDGEEYFGGPLYLKIYRKDNSRRPSMEVIIQQRDSEEKIRVTLDSDTCHEIMERIAQIEALYFSYDLVVAPATQAAVNSADETSKVSEDAKTS